MKPENISVFPMGEKNGAFAQYFVGQSYLNMLSTERVTIGNVTFEPGCRNNWHIHIKAVKFCFVPLDGVIIRSGAKKHRNYTPVML